MLQFNSDELIGTTEYLTVQARCRINRYRCNRVRLYKRQGVLRQLTSRYVKLKISNTSPKAKFTKQ
jgi:hypothetical protein